MRRRSKDECLRVIRRQPYGERKLDSLDVIVSALHITNHNSQQFDRLTNYQWDQLSAQCLRVISHAHDIPTACKTIRCFTSSALPTSTRHGLIPIHVSPNQHDYRALQPFQLHPLKQPGGQYVLPRSTDLTVTTPHFPTHQHCHGTVYRMCIFAYVPLDQCAATDSETPVQLGNAVDNHKQ
uniref:Uncharacterized protein n=1 Tax=Toxoplasma gondii COUG TaxID=1074873 RepID=A0A2G8Y6J9_TOXGO|nr:hypothetical protein TGCOUG_356020 [Toxoplasma gondii COUG]